MDINKILSADILDVIFEGKNKNYGAYELRKTYNKRLATALIVTGSVVLLIFLGSLLFKLLGSDKPEQIKVKEIEMAN
ncbi:MAG: energy transducer TonB, partial [Ferruginibacter sp.]